MKNSDERWKGTVTGVATYQTYRLDSFHFLKLATQKPLKEGMFTFSARLLDDPSPTPVIHEFTVRVDRIDFMSGGRQRAIVSLVRDDGSQFYMQVFDNTDAVEFEIIT